MQSFNRNIDEKPERVPKSVPARADEIGVTTAHIYNEARRGRLVLSKFGRVTRILDDDWIAYLQSCRGNKAAG